MLEQPFIYAYDADGLTNGQDYQRNAIQLQSDSAFMSRKLSGRNLVCESLRVYDKNSNFMHSAAIVAPQDYPIIPEEQYPPNGQIQFDLFGVSKASRAYAAPGSVDNFYSQIAFQGAKIYNDRNPPAPTPYQWRPRFYQYTQTVTISQTGRLAPDYTALNTFNRFSLEMNNYDFELCNISFLVKLSGASDAIISDSYFKFMFKDQFSNYLMNVPILDSFLNNISAENVSVFPTPTLLYPVGSFIVMDVYSLLIESQVPADLTITYTGYWRVPC